jgi:hypothetical protein
MFLLLKQKLAQKKGFILWATCPKREFLI